MRSMLEYTEQFEIKEKTTASLWQCEDIIGTVVEGLKKN